MGFSPLVLDGDTQAQRLHSPAVVGTYVERSRPGCLLAALCWEVSIVHLVFSRAPRGTWGPRGMEIEKGSARGRHPGAARSTELPLPCLPMAGGDRAPPAASLPGGPSGFCTVWARGWGALQECPPSATKGRPRHPMAMPVLWRG